MKVVVAIDSFKGSLSSEEAARSISEGIRAARGDAEISVCPLADGGEGTVAALASALGAEYTEVTVSDPIRRPVRCEYAVSEKGGEMTAIMEMSAAAGITLVSGSEKDPRVTTTYGVGEMIADALSRGCRRFVVGIGGSATNDGGIGMLAALGYKFYDKEGTLIPPYGAQAAGRVSRIDASGVRKELSESRFLVACDVKNPLCGSNGCSAVFSPQKGATAECAKEMDAELSTYAGVVRLFNPSADMNAPGAGAAGGLGFAFLAFLDASLVPGAELVIRECGLEDMIREADVVVTGEGRMDLQSAMGKAPSAVAAVAKKYEKRVIAFCGAVGGTDDPICADIDAVFPIPTAPTTLEAAMDKPNAHRNLRFTAEQVFRVISD
ncbi:MAG: glycerate kinase [Clostridia bacterium]|nr:glycerate kinase [Clostridia bacterium]